MPDDLHDFLRRLAAVVVMALLPVMFIAFVSMPLSLGRHPGEPWARPAQADPSFAHMT